MTNINEIAKQMVTDGKGILAADESSGTIKKRFDGINVDSSEENRMNYRRILLESKRQWKTTYQVLYFLMKQFDNLIALAKS